MSSKRHPFSRYVIRFGIVIGIYLLLATTFTTTVDPWRVLRMPWALDSLEEYRDFSDAHRTGKAGLAMDPKGWEIAYFGSSRIEMGLTTDYAGFEGKRVVNLGLAGGLTEENTAMAKFAIRKNPNLKTILFGIDSGDLTSRVNLTGQTDFLRSPLAEGQSIVERNLGYLTGVRALTESFVVVSNRFKDKKSKYELTGQRVGNLGEPPPLRDYVEIRKPFYQSQARAFDTTEDSPLNMEKFALLSDFLEETRAAGIRIILVIPPRHALMQIHPVANDPAAAPWVRERTELAELCEKINSMDLSGEKITFLDFCTFSPLNTQPLPGGQDAPFPDWPDLEHCTGSLGLKVVEKCFGEDSEKIPAWGVNVLDTGIEEHLSRLRKGHMKYCKEHPKDVAWFRSKVLSDNNE